MSKQGKTRDGTWDDENVRTKSVGVGESNLEASLHRRKCNKKEHRRINEPLYVDSLVQVMLSFSLDCLTVDGGGT